MSADKCPVDHSKWPTESSAPHPMRPDAAAIPRSAPAPAELSKDRVVSSIPRLFLGEESNKEEKWVYPSPAQFHAALQRKERAGEAKDMDIIVPIHNAVNERCWEQVMQWEAKEGPLDQVKLISFKGRPQDRTPRAWFKTIIGFVRLFAVFCSLRLNAIADIRLPLIDTTGWWTEQALEFDT